MRKTHHETRGIQKNFAYVLHAGGGLLGVLVYLAAVGFLVFAISGMTGGHFVYTLDDPYIHLALAERIRAGLYGINAGEFASPSSSMVWPFLFVLFARAAWLRFLPLCFNTILGCATVALLAQCVRRAFHLREEATNRRARFLVVLLIFALNLPGLTLTGMEHVLQVLLSVCCAYAVLCLMDDAEPPRWTLAAALLLPCVRYEGFLLTASVGLAFWGTRRRRSALLLVGCSTVIPVTFSIFLLHLGLPAFPLSVILKSSAQVQAGSGWSARLIGTALHIVLDTLRDPERASELILSFVLGYLALRNRNRPAIFYCAVAGCFAALVQTVLGPNGWFFRYEIAPLAFTLLLAIAVDIRTSPKPTAARPGEGPFSAGKPSGAVLVSVAALAVIYMQPLLATPAAALGIYEQQFQIARLARDFYPRPVAVNDIGLVSFGRDASQSTLDLYGLGSLESARVPPENKTPAWLDAVTREHHIGLVAIYPEWFKAGVPATWVALGKLCSPHAQVSAVSSRVMLYATPLDKTRVEEAVQRFAQTVPKGVSLELHPADSLNTCLGK